MELVAAHVYQAAGMREFPSLQGGGHALVGCTGQHEKDGDRGYLEQPSLHARERHDSLSASPYFSMREYSWARVRPSSLAARVLLCRACDSALTTSERSMASRLTPPAGNAVDEPTSPLMAAWRGDGTGRCSLRM